MHLVHGEIVTQGTVTDLRTAGILNSVTSLALEKDRRRNGLGATSGSSEDGVTGDDEGTSNSDEDMCRATKNA